jgi:tRNA modification GTPase
MEFDTIAAIATPMGSGGIGIIKISGKDAFSITGSIFKRSCDPPDEGQDRTPLFSSLRSHRLYHGHIVNSENGKVLDEVLVSKMKAPRTYTREDVVEINTHSGHVVLESILDLVLKSGARLAEPGEFTKRAYLNGRIDLTQAEAVIDIINSRTEKSLEIATSQIKGGLKSTIESVRNTLLDILTDAEAAIDFPEDVGEIIDAEETVGVLEKRVVEVLKELVDQYEHARYLRDGLKMAVIGRPNVGKSSLMNRLIKEDRVIVTPIPGTTRDLIEETLNIHGIPVVIADTAGLHDTHDPVEVIGIEKTQEYINGSDLILFMMDASDPLTAEDIKIFETVKHKPLIMVINKIDLVGDDFEPRIPGPWEKIPTVNISALYSRGLSRLKDSIAKLATGEKRLEVRNRIVPNLRHKIALEESLQLAVSAAREVRNGTPFELIAIDIQEAIDRLGEIIGVSAREEVLDQIFSRFCIGK